MTLLAEIIQAIRFNLDTRRSALGTIRWLKRSGIVPATLVDAGANNSQWMKYLSAQWPTALVLSFEPQPFCRPIGNWIRVGLSDKPGTGSLALETHNESRWTRGGSTRVQDSPAPNQEPVQIATLDQYESLINPPAVLKVDCEDHTLAVLRGAPKTIGRFACVLAEVFEDIFAPTSAVPNQHLEIHQLMLGYGFDRAMTVGAIPWLTTISQTDVLFWKKTQVHPL